MNTSSTPKIIISVTTLMPVVVCLLFVYSVSYKQTLQSTLGLGSGAGITDALPAEIWVVCLFWENMNTKVTLDLPVVKDDQLVQ